MFFKTTKSASLLCTCHRRKSSMWVADRYGAMSSCCHTIYHHPPTHTMHRQQSETEVEEEEESLWHLSSFNAFTGLGLLLEVTERERESEHEMVVRVMMMGCYNF